MGGVDESSPSAARATLCVLKEHPTTEESEGGVSVCVCVRGGECVRV